MLAVVNTKTNDVLDVLSDHSRIGGLNPDLAVYRCDATGDEKTLADLPVNRVDATADVAVKRGDEEAGVSLREQLATRRAVAESALAVVRA